MPSPSMRFRTALLANTSSISDGSSYGSGAIADWDPGYYNGTCANRLYFMTGLSFSTADGKMNKQLCSYAPGVSGQAAVLKLPGDQSRFLRTGSWSGIDWDPGFYKLQCGETEYVSAVSQSTTGNAHAVRCTKGFGQKTACEVKRATTTDSRGDTASGEWDSMFRKAECSVNKVVVGISVSPQTQKVNGIMCCDHR